jgi:hypothetical protein
MLRSTVIGTLLLAGMVAQEAAAQRRVAGTSTTAASEGTTEVSIIAQVGTKSYTSRVPGSCKYAPAASIYDVPAALWTVQADGSDGAEIKGLSFTLWRPKNGSADQVSISLETGSSSNRIDVNPRNPPVGAATVQLQPVGTGGKFEIRGKDAAGTKLNLTISCPEFAGIEAEGG